jgi:integration host factor subunit alpha
MIRSKALTGSGLPSLSLGRFFGESAFCFRVVAGKWAGSALPRVGHWDSAGGKGCTQIFLGGNLSLTKDKLIIRLQTQIGLDKQESRQIVERLLGIMKETLTQGEDLLISGFGKFSVRQKNARRGRNPQTKESLVLAPRKVLVFKASGVLRNRINESS